MKKKLMTLVCLCVLAVFAGDVLSQGLSAVSGNRRDRIISELQTEWNKLVNNSAYFTNITITGTLSAEQVTSTDDATITDTLTVGTVNQKPSSGAGVSTVTGNETNNADLVLDADDGDDNADTWTIRSATADNNLDFLNHTTEAFNMSAAGTLSVLGGFDAIGAVDMDYGSVDVTDHTFTTDGTGDTEIVLPNDSIGAAEILDASLVFGHIAEAGMGADGSFTNVSGTTISVSNGIITAITAP